jgi:signal transduction histidine kinase
MRLTAMRRRDAAALLLAIVTALAGMTAWLLRDVDIGLRLDYDEEGFVRVTEVVSGSVAESYGFQPGMTVVELQRTDGNTAFQRASELRNNGQLDGYLNNEGASDTLFMHFAAELVPERDIAYIYAVQLSGQEPYVDYGVSIDRYSLQSRLDGAGILLLVGIGLGLAVAAAVSQGWAGEAFAAESRVAGVAVAVPLMALTLVFSGTVATATVGAMLPILGVLPLGWSLAEAFPEDGWARLLGWTAIGFALLAVLLPLRQLIGYRSAQEEQVLLAASVTMVPAVALALAGQRTTRQRLQILALGAVPAAAVLTQVGNTPELVPLVLLIGAILAWRLLPALVTIRLPFERRPRVAAPAMAAETVVEHDSPAAQSRRDLAALVLAASTFAAGLVTCCEGGAVIGGALFGALLAFALHRGLLGPGWVRASIPLGSAVAIPLMALTFSDGGGTQYLARLLLPALGALPVAHLLAWRHPDPAWRRLLFGISLVLVAVALLAALASSYGGPLGGPYDFTQPESRLTIYLALGFIALVPGLGSALAPSEPDVSSPTGRLDLVAIGLTPGVAMTVLPQSYSPNFFILVAWVIAVVAWRRFTIAPLLGLAQRTQRQRDLAVAAVEAERARLAADIHDDALQELSALVRRLDTAGDPEGADLARSVAERLRAITSDLRLPLLDDLGAGPALEWLVGRFQPLTDGVVRLERVDPQRPPAGVELAVFRVAQEALANAVKHGKPPITVRYRVDEAGAVSLSVDDEGPGIEPDAAEVALRAGHLGVANMQQRAQQIGALLDIRRWPSGGTHVAMEWRPR